MSKPRVLHLITRLLQGGAEAKTLAELEALHGRYAFTLCFGASFSPAQRAHVERLGVPTRRLASLRHYDPFSLSVACVQLYRFMKRTHFDVVHTHSTEAGIVGRLAAHWANVPVVVHTLHGVPFTEQRNPVLRQFLLTLERTAAPWTQRFVANAQIIKETYLNAGVGHEGQYEVVPSGVDLERFACATPVELACPEKMFKVLTAARLTAGKGLFELLQAAREMPDAVFFIAGEGPLRHKLETQIERFGLGERVRLLGHRQDLAGLMRAVDLFVLPSYREGTPRVISEALAAGLPIVATNVDGIPEQVEHGVNGLLVPPRQVRPLVSAMLALADDEAQRVHMGKNSQERAQKFSQRTMVAALDELYQDLLYSAPS